MADADGDDDGIAAVKCLARQCQTRAEPKYIRDQLMGCAVGTNLSSMAGKRAKMRGRVDHMSQTCTQINGRALNTIFILNSKGTYVAVIKQDYYTLPVTVFTLCSARCAIPDMERVRAPPFITR